MSQCKCVFIIRYFKTGNNLWGKERGMRRNPEGQFSGGVLEWLPGTDVHINGIDPKYNF